MIVIQIVPADDLDAYRLLRSKVIHEAKTWDFSNKAKTRLVHINSGGYIDIGNAKGVVAARVYPKEPKDQFFLVEKFVGRLVAWFSGQLVALNMQFVPDPPAKKRRRRREVGRTPGGADPHAMVGGSSTAAAATASSTLEDDLGMLRNDPQ